MEIEGKPNEFSQPYSVISLLIPLLAFLRALSLTTLQLFLPRLPATLSHPHILSNISLSSFSLPSLTPLLHRLLSTTQLQLHQLPRVATSTLDSSALLKESTTGQLVVSGLNSSVIK
jgi:hypothetical protein